MCMMAMLAASAVYNLTRPNPYRRILRRIDEAAIFRAVEAMREIADQAAHTSKAARRQKERRRMVQRKQAVAAPAAPAPLETNDLPANGQQPHEQMFPFEEWN